MFAKFITVVEEPETTALSILTKSDNRELSVDSIPNDLAEYVVNRGTIFSYANFVCEPNTVKVADPVLIIVNTYASVEEAFPAAGAVPPCHFGVTAAPSI